MSRTVRLKVYLFNELSTKAQAKAIEDERPYHPHDNWHENTYADAAMIGLEILSFDLNRANYCTINFKEDPAYTSFKILDLHGPETRTYKLAEQFRKDWDSLIDTWARDTYGDFLNQDLLDSALDKLEASFKKSLEDEYKFLLQSEYDELTSDTSIKQFIIGNDYEYKHDGTRF